MNDNILQYKGFSGSVKTSIEDNCLHGKILFIDDLVTYEAETIAQLKAEFEAAVDDYLATCQKLGRRANKPFSGTFNVRIGPELHQYESCKLTKLRLLESSCKLANPDLKVKGLSLQMENEV